MIDKRTRNAILHKCGKESIPRVAEQYGVSKNTVRHIWAEAKDGRGRHSPWYVPWLNPQDPDEGDQDANILKILQIAWYYRHDKAGLVWSQEQDFSRAYDVITAWDLLSEKAKRLIAYIIDIDAFPEEYSHQDGTPWTFKEWNAQYDERQGRNDLIFTEADLKEYDDYKLHYPEIYNLYRSEIEYREHGPARLDPYRKYRTKQHKYGH